MKKLINKAEDVVNQSLAGFVAAHTDLVKVSYEPRYVFRADAPISGKVAIVSGGGSGHEPMHAGFVGHGMLDAACPGDIFTSPTPDQIVAATKAVDGGVGVLHIVKNYTGDIMNFEMAAEMIEGETSRIIPVVITDDVAVENSLYTAGRRGVGITVLAEKVAGAAAQRLMKVMEVADVCRKVNENGRSMGMALTSCTVPAAGKPTFEIAEDQMEIGIGIHGEPGRTRMELKEASVVAEMLTDAIISDLPFRNGDEVIALINGMGGTPLIELYLIFGEFRKICDQRGIRVVRSLVGNYITSLEMAGCSITLLKTDDLLTSLWDDPVLTPALRWGL